MKRILACVPNFSEGRDLSVIEEITNAIESVEGIYLLDVDPGRDTNRMVVTFAGEPEAVVEAAFRGIQTAARLIDMRKHQGEHPRFGATDVCPLVPVSDISMEETVVFAHALAERVGREAGIPVYCYEYAAACDERRSLANCRAGEYEGLKEKIIAEAWKPDFGPAEWSDAVARTGATALGARNFLVAYNVNLNTTSVRRANAVAFDVRESGRVVREGHPLTGRVVRGEDGEPKRIPGSLKSTRAIGWYIREYGMAQISMNLTDIHVTPIHVAFEAVCERAWARGMRVTGSELVGLIPLQAMLDAGRYFLHKQQRSAGIPDEEIIRIAVKSMGLDELRPFEPRKKIIEYRLADAQKPASDSPILAELTLRQFVWNTANDNPTPGGGSVAAAAGALGAALATMVANLSAHKRGWDHRWEEFSRYAERGKEIGVALLKCVDSDAEAFNRVMAAYKMPKSTEAEKLHKQMALQAAMRMAIEAPLQVMLRAHEAIELAAVMAREGIPQSVTDAAVGAICARAAIEGALLNVKVNASGCSDRSFSEKTLAEGEVLAASARKAEAKILKMVNEKIGC